MSETTRRPRRAAKPNKKYTTDPFEEHRDLLVESSGSDTSSVDDDVSSDDEFDEGKAAAAAAEEAEEEVDSDEEVVREPPSPEGGAGGEEVLSDGGSIVEVKQKKNPLPKRPPPMGRGKILVADRSAFNNLPIFDPRGAEGAKGRAVVYSRGVPELSHHQSKDYRLLYNVGPGEEDLIANIHARERWLNDVTLPYRKENKKGMGGGLAYSPFYPEEKRKKEADEGLEWYYGEGGDQAFQNEVLKVSELEASWSCSDSIVVGTAGSQKLYDGIEPLGSWNMGEARVNGPKAAEHESWVINAGDMIQCLEWVPNQADSSQFLAIATTSVSSQHLDPETTAQAYNPKPSTVHCLQIWEVFATGSLGDEGSRVDYSRKPRLRCVISSDWGHIKKMKWCPTPDRPTADLNHLGLLATIWGDGKLRVFDIHTPPDHIPTAYVHTQKAAFESKPPDTICTCLTWLSSMSIAVGTANGSVAIWSLPDAIAQEKKKEYDGVPRPWFYTLIHQSYIISIASGYPSRPHILITFSLDGHTRATDLRSPLQDTVTSTRTRISQGPVIWHDITQTALNIDDNFTLRSYSLRLFYRTVSVGRFTAFASDIAVSPLHASVMVGCVDGSVHVTNPMRRLRDHKLRPWVQCVMKHEWRRPITKPRDRTQPQPQPDSRSPEQNDDADMQDAAEFDQTNSTPSQEDILSKPAIRIITGHKLTRPDLSQSGLSNATKDLVSYATVYEEKTAIRQVCWNPNLRAGTWAAVGTGSGLVIIKDLGVD